jgi:hypothetical protein
VFPRAAEVFIQLLEGLFCRRGAVDYVAVNYPAFKTAGQGDDLDFEAVVLSINGADEQAGPLRHAPGGIIGPPLVTAGVQDTRFGDVVGVDGGEG